MCKYEVVRLCAVFSVPLSIIWEFLHFYPVICIAMKVKTENGCGNRLTRYIEFSENSDTFQDTHSEPIRNSIEIDGPMVFENV